MEFLYEYGLFFAKTLTFVVAIAIIVGVVAGAATVKGKPKKGQLSVTDLTEQYQTMAEEFHQQLLGKKAFKQWQKAQSKNKTSVKPKLFVVDFNGSMDAREAESLREEVTAILAVATKEDEVLLRLESGGGVVHGYGLAASQLDRLRQQQINLTVAIDKVAASGGYMMASVANQILAAPFAYIGSIGVALEAMNFNQVLKNHDIGYEQITAGKYKRTLSTLGENTPSSREKAKQDLEIIHTQFKALIQKHRPTVDIDTVATGEVWLGATAYEKNLVDRVCTSNEYICELIQKKNVYHIQCHQPKKLTEKLTAGLSSVLDTLIQKIKTESKGHYE